MKKKFTKKHRKNLSIALKKVRGEVNRQRAIKKWAAKDNWGLGVEKLRKLFRDYTFQRKNARFRKIEFKLSFEQWVDVWVASGQIENRGKKRSQFCMARFGDKGAYELGNVRIITGEQNWLEVDKSFQHRPRSEESKRKQRIAMMGVWKKKRECHANS